MLNENYKEEGFWWISNNPNRKYPGEFQFDVDSGLSLTLRGIEGPPADDARVDQIPTIYGVLASGHLMTLVDCEISTSSRPLTGIDTRVSTQKLIPKMGYFGCHLPIEQPLFRAAFFSLSLALKWLKNSGFEIEAKNPFRNSNVDIKYREPKDIEIEFKDEVKLTIRRHLIRIPTTSHSDREKVELQETVVFELRLSEPKPIEYFIKSISSFRDFLTIVCDSLCEIRKIYLEGNFLDERYKDRPEEIYAFSDLLFVQPHRKNRGKELDSRDFLFTYPDAEGKINLVINSWFEKYDKFRVIKDLYISGLYSPFNYLETQFLSLAQALEVYHRRFWAGEYLLLSEFESDVKRPLCEALATSLSEEFRTVTQQRIGFMNEYSLSKRLKDLTNEYKDLLSEFYPNTKLIVRGVVDVRNYLTHYSSKNHTDDFFEVRDNFVNVVEYIYFLKFMLDICFLRELGFDKTELYEFFIRNGKYRSKLHVIK